MSVAGELCACFFRRFFICMVMQSNPYSARGKGPRDRTTDAARRTRHKRCHSKYGVAHAQSRIATATPAACAETAATHLPREARDGASDLVRSAHAAEARGDSRDQVGRGGLLAQVGCYERRFGALRSGAQRNRSTNV